MIIGRAKEISELNEAYSSKKAEFIAIYGRRRIGKTFLIRNFFIQKNGIYFQTTGIKDALLEKQLARFAQEIGAAFYKNAPMRILRSWIDAFDVLTEAINKQPKNKKIMLFFDELPWLATHKSGVLQALEYFWNRHWSNDKRIKLTVCGSTASWMINKIIKNKGGLHNRVTRRICLKPFSLYETQLYLKSLLFTYNIQQITRVYMALGGIPFYLQQLKKGKSVDQNINRLLFNADSTLFYEFDEVFSSLFDHAEQYRELIILIASRKDGILRSELESRNKMTGKGGMLTTRLEHLETAGFITSYIPYGRSNRGTYYRINDEYSYFYLTWIEPVKSKLKHESETKYWKECIHTPKYYAWMGYAFENICYKHIALIKQKLGINESALVSPWRYVPLKNSDANGAQIDLLFDRNDDAITLSDIKYTEKSFIIDKEYAEKLKRKIDVFRQKTHTKKQIFLSLIAANGVKENKYYYQLVDSVATLKDLFSDIYA